ncbi:MAG: flavodoxin, partial [Muribaculaceae bacterium]|nr:flavodoxin [Muribaculaceae bacterium]
KEINMKNSDKTLVVFFSHIGENYAVGNITEGNTHIIANMIADATGAKTFEIVPEKAYPESYNECIDVAKKELQSNARPAIKDDIDISEYDTIFLGYPNWWGQPPMCVFTFIEGHDWKGKTVIPFITHEGSGMGGTDRKIAEACKGANVAVGKGLAVRGATAQNDRDTAHKTVTKWLEKL